MGSRGSRLFKGSIFLIVVIAIAIGSRKVDVRQLLSDAVPVAQTWKSEWPLTTSALAIVLVIAWILSFMPLTPLEVSLGFVFGMQVGYLVVFTGKVLGCSAAFMLGRTLAHSWAQRQFGKHELLRAINLAVAREPYKICFIVRLAYVPISLKNFGLAIVSVKPTTFFTSLFCVEIFNSSILVAVGDTAKNLSALMSGKEPKSPGQIAVMVMGSVFLLALFGYVSVLTRRALQEIREEQGAGEAIQKGSAKTRVA
mmetsp:Transcript_119724/g.298622  ORF Transcript_119724/g.298622 Transcript_119724/m.298622 type:complete len:254 (-) Transcript_119724:78-839(-)